MNKTQKVYMLKLSFPDFSKDNVLKAARTLSRKPIVLNGRRLQHPSNEVFCSEYDEQSDEIQVILLSVESEIQEIYERKKRVFATATISKNPSFVLPHLLNFVELVLSTKPIKFGHETTLNRIQDLDEALRMLP